MKIKFDYFGPLAVLLLIGLSFSNYRLYRKCQEYTSEGYGEGH